MKTVATIILVCLSFWVKAQDLDSNVNKHLIETLDRMPLFVVGDSNMYKYVLKQINYPVVAKDNGIEGRVYVQFIIDEEGSVLSPRVYGNKRLGAGLEEEAIRVVANMPKWKPAIYKKKPTRVVYVLPVTFRLE